MTRTAAAKPKAPRWQAGGFVKERLTMLRCATCGKRVNGDDLCDSCTFDREQIERADYAAWMEEGEA